MIMQKTTIKGNSITKTAGLPTKMTQVFFCHLKSSIEEFILEKLDTYGKTNNCFLNLYSVNKNTTENQIRDFYSGVDILNVWVNKENYRIYDLEFKNRQELIKALETGTGQLNEENFYFRYSFKNELKGDSIDFIIRGNDPCPKDLCNKYGNKRGGDNRGNRGDRRNDGRGERGRGGRDRGGYGGNNEGSGGYYGKKDFESNRGATDEDYKYGGGRNKGYDNKRGGFGMDRRGGSSRGGGRGGDMQDRGGVKRTRGGYQSVNANEEEVQRLLVLGKHDDQAPRKFVSSKGGHTFGTLAPKGSGLMIKMEKEGDLGNEAHQPNFEKEP